MEHAFKINLRGIIDLLSEHLYSGPKVYVRELLQNAVDAIRARSAFEPDHRGEVRIELMPAKAGRAPALVFVDDGIGLNEEEVHRFLATIGQTSKRGDYFGFERPVDFIGRFGIGLLSCFVVAEEIVVITRSARGEDAKTIEWRGRPDGTYTLKPIDHAIEPGTQVYLTAKAGSEEYFEPDRVRELAAHFGGLLPYPIRVVAGKDTTTVNADGAPWRRRYPNPEDRTEALLEYGYDTFGIRFFDAIPVKAEAGKLDGVAFVLPESPSLATRRTHRVYLKNMLLSEDAEGLLPDWAFFVKCVVNADELRPTASRESFYEDEALAETREALGRALRDYLVGLADRDPKRLRRLIDLHHLSIKALAVRDDDFYRLFIDWLPFETSMGLMTFGEYRKAADVVRFVPNLDQFRQIASVAAAQGLAILNGAYTYDAELLAKFPDVFPGERAEVVGPDTLLQALEDLTLDQREEVFELIRTADLVLQPFRCAAEIKAFRPEELPTLYSTQADAEFFRSVEQSKEVADEHWKDLLDGVAGPGTADPYAQLCFNYRNPLIRKIARLTDRTLLRRSIEMLYVQALLLGHHPLNAKEMALLNRGLLGLIEWGVAARGGADERGV
ncbi:MAG TPA: HSP90 family protein [Isosphaeraceae bacterium]|nr:HSP90 family protein [Isosphaeraceae bacterium]